MLVSRRDTLAAASVLGVIAVAPAVAEAVDERPKEGDFLVAVKATNTDGLSPKDITGPVIAWPMDPAAKLIRNGFRINKVPLVRLDPETLVGPTRERAADGCRRLFYDLSPCGLRGGRLDRRPEKSSNARATIQNVIRAPSPARSSYPTISGVNSVPVSFAVDGQQYIAVQAGWGVDAARMHRRLNLLFPGSTPTCRKAARCMYLR
jgi:hypothetical protein